MSIANDSGISAHTSGEGKSGDITIKADFVMLAKGGFIENYTSGPGNAGNVVIKPRALNKMGFISMNGDGQKHWSGISASTYSDSGNGGHGGNVSVETNGTMTLLNGGGIDASTHGVGKARSVTVKADMLNIDGSGNWGPSGIYTAASQSSTGEVGDITVHANKSINLSNQGKISIVNIGNATYPFNITTGHVEVTTPNLILNQGTITSSTYGNVRAGSITVDATQSILETNGSKIVAATKGIGGAGSVKVNTLLLTVDNSSISAEAKIGSSGQTGNVEVKVDKTIKLVNSGTISIENEGVSTDPASVAPGVLNVATPDLKLDGGAITAASSGNVQAGSIIINATKSIAESNGAIISAETTGQGGAGSVKVNAPALRLDNASLSAQAGPDSSGGTGNVDVAAKTISLLNGGKISIENAAVVPNPGAVQPGSLSVSALDIRLRDSQITSRASGNVAASPVAVNFARSLCLERASITTEAQDGDGGALAVRGGQLLQLINSKLATTANSGQGSGGDIGVGAVNLVMETGLVQANANGGYGGNITLLAGGLVPSGEQLIVGGAVPIDDWRPGIFGYNIIQAASRARASGTINSAAPQLGLSGVLAKIDKPRFDARPVGEDFCALGRGSALTQAGSGGLPPRAKDWPVEK